MNKTFAVIALAVGMTFSGAAAFGQTVRHPPTNKTTSQDMVAMCDSMMHDMTAGPVLRQTRERTHAKTDVFNDDDG